MNNKTFISKSEIRGMFSRAMSEMYAKEVPAYQTLVDVSREVNEDFLAKHPEARTQRESLETITAERHGAIRLGRPDEARNMARLFAVMDMHPVGFYDLREAAKASVPVISTAYRPVTEEALEQNPFRMFTSLLVTDDRRFFDEETQAEVEAFLAQRNIFTDRVMEMIDLAEKQGGLAQDEAEEFVAEALKTFQLSHEPVPKELYEKVKAVSGVAADIACFPNPHINHLTPRVLDIDDLYQRMEKRGISMIEKVQGPPAVDGIDVLLRQTSFRAIAVPTEFYTKDGEIVEGEHRARFGEVEQRAAALTPEGRALYDKLYAEAIEAQNASGQSWQEAAQPVFEAGFPKTFEELVAQGLAYFELHPTEKGKIAAGQQLSGVVPLETLLADGYAVRKPIVYEDFLPKSAAGIFQSNLDDDGTKDVSKDGSAKDGTTLSSYIGRPILDPYQLYATQQAHSIANLYSELGVAMPPELSTRVNAAIANDPIQQMQEHLANLRDAHIKGGAGVEVAITTQKVV